MIIMKDVYLEFLDNLRDSAKINMMQSAPYLARTFKLSEEESVQVLQYWMSTYTQRRLMEKQNKGDMNES